MAATIPLWIVTSRGRLSFLSATTIFGNPVYVSLRKIALEMLNPADARFGETPSPLRSFFDNATGSLAFDVG